MVEDVIINLILPVFRQCAYWADQLLAAVGGAGVVLAAFLIVLVIGLLFIPMRGNAAMNIKAYSEKKIYSDKRAKAKAQAKSNSKKGG